MNPDNTPRMGVVISLSGSSLKTTTDENGAWTLLGSSTAVFASQEQKNSAPEQNLFVQRSRLQIDYSGCDAAGRSHGAPQTSAHADEHGASRIFATAPDTLIYTWNGTVILRDTITDLNQLGILRLFDTTINPRITYGYVRDTEGHQYRTVRIGSQVWMAENMNYSGSESKPIGSSRGPYGRLYRWTEVMGIDSSYINKAWGGKLPHIGICPVEWHVPSSTEWATLIAFAGGETAANRLKSTTEWVKSGNGNDYYGFRALPSGTIYTGEGYQAGWWTSSAASLSPTSAKNLEMKYDSTNVYAHNYEKKAYFSLRCIHDQE